MYSIVGYINSLRAPAGLQISASERLVSRFARPTQSLIPEIDGLRLIAIGSVIVDHVWARMAFWIPGTTGQMGFFKRILSQGYFGVMLFFVLSGFILSLPFAEHALAGGRKVNLQFYFVRRVVRIEPPYVLNILFATLLSIVLLGHPVSEVFPHFLAHLVYLHNLIYQIHYLGRNNDLYINGVTWSLEVEIQFYMLAPFFCVVYLIRNTTFRRGLMLGVMVLGALSSQLFLSANAVARMSIIGYLEYFFAGLLLADIYVLTWKEIPRKSNTADILGVLVALALTACLVSSPMFSVGDRPLPGLHWSILAPFLTLVFYGCVFCGRYLKAFMTNPWVVVTGGMCYSFYLYHSLIIGAMFSRGTLRFYNPRLPFAINFATQCGLILPVVAAVSACFYLLFEQPFMRRELQKQALGIVFPRAASSVIGPERTSVSSPLS